MQPELFAAAGGQPNCWADFDGDGDLDLFVGFEQGVANRLYRNDRGTFSDVAAELGVADLNDTRAASWGDFDGDGDVDLFVGFTRKTEIPSKLYRNEGAGKPFVDVAKAMGIDAPGESGSHRSSISTTMATSISSSDSAMRRTCSSATTARAS